MTGNWIISERKNRGVSQNKLAKFMGIPSATLSAWELDKKEPSNEELKQLKKAFKDYDKAHDSGKIPKKRNITGTIEHKKVPTFSKDSWNDIEIKYPKSYLKNFTVEKSEEASNGGPKAIALFAGCGGMSLGFKNAGFDVIGYVEIEKSARDIYAANFQNSECLGKDVCDITDKQIKSWKQKFGHISILCGGPPCQGFSLAGKRDIHDARNQLYRNYLNIAKLLKPEVVVLENVRQLIFSAKFSET